MRLHNGRRTESFERVGDGCVLFFISAVWQSESRSPTFFHISLGDGGAFNTLIRKGKSTTNPQVFAPTIPTTPPRQRFSAPSWKQLSMGKSPLSTALLETRGFQSSLTDIVKPRQPPKGIRMPGSGLRFGCNTNAFIPCDKLLTAARSNMWTGERISRSAPGKLSGETPQFLN